MANVATALFDRINASFLRQGLMQTLGARLVRVGPGLCEFALPYSPKVTQQQHTFHGGAVAAIADIAGGYAGLTTLEQGSEITTVEFKINLLASKQGGELRAVGKAVKSGKRIVVTTAEVHHVDEKTQERTLLAVMQQTLVPVVKKYE
jgi:uncharacterized protein (TIGR00369 family)